MLDRRRDLTESGATKFTVETLDKSLTRGQTLTKLKLRYNYANFVVRIKQIFIFVTINVPNEFLQIFFFFLAEMLLRNVDSSKEILAFLYFITSHSYVLGWQLNNCGFHS